MVDGYRKKKLKTIHCSACMTPIEETEAKVQVCSECNEAIIKFTIEDIIEKPIVQERSY